MLPADRSSRLVSADAVLINDGTEDDAAQAETQSPEQAQALGDEFGSDSSLSPAPSDNADATPGHAATSTEPSNSSNAALASTDQPGEHAQGTEQAVDGASTNGAGAAGDSSPKSSPAIDASSEPAQPPSPAKTDVSMDIKRPQSGLAKRPGHSRASSTASIVVPDVDATQASKRAAMVLQLNGDLMQCVPLCFESAVCVLNACARVLQGLFDSGQLRPRDV